MKKLLLLLTAICLLAGVGFAQTRPLTGTVVDAETGETIPNASITIKGNTKGTTADMQGHFRLDIPTSGTAIILVSSIGYNKIEIQPGNRQQLTVKLKSAIQELNEVVAIGYATVRRKDLTGAVSSITAQQLKDVPINSAEQALTGRLAGVQVTTAEGSPDAQVKITVRGGGSVTQDNSPLYIIDGVQVEDALASLSPQDIQSIDVLKDASATAIYGARGANGVVLVTTKSGKAGKMKVSYNATFGLNKLAKELSVLQPYDFLVYQYERSRGNTADSTKFATTYAKTFADLNAYQNTPGVDWQKLVLGNTGNMQTHNLGLNGGSKLIKYNASYTNNHQKGTVLNTDYLRNLANVKIDLTTKKLTVSVSGRYSNANTKGAGTSDPSTAVFNNLRNVVKYRPFQTGNSGPTDFDEEYFDDTNVGNGLGIVNPYILNNAQYRRKNTTISNVSGYVNYNITRSISFRATAGANFNRGSSKAFDDTVTSRSRQLGLATPFVSIQDINNNSLNQSNVFSYTNAGTRGNFSKNNSITALVGQEIYISHTTGSNSQLRQFPVNIAPADALKNLALGTYLPSYPQPTDYKSTLMSFFGRLNYSYLSKYLLTFSMRADGSSKFAAGHQWGYFPSGSLAWRISEEKFLKDHLGVLSDLKLRVSYGQSGNNRIDDYLYQTSFTPTALYQLNDGTNIGYEPGYLANPELQWETTTSKNIGADIGLFKDRLQLSVDIYRNETNNVLIQSPVSITSGYVNQLQNIGATLNKGLELQLTAVIVRAKSFSWNSNFNISFNRNTVERISKGQNFYLVNSGWGISGQPADFIVKVGSPVGSMYGYVNDGFYQVSDFNYDVSTHQYTLKTGVPDPSKVIGVAQPGLAKFKDVNNDGVITDADKVIIGNANPKFYGGLNQQFTWKNFDASIFVNFQAGNKILNANKIEFTNGYAPYTNMLSVMGGRWRTVDANGNVLQSVSAANVVTGVSPDQLAAANQNATMWMPLRGGVSYFPTSWAVEDGSFLRINNISLGYTFKSALLKKALISNLRVYATLNNVAVITGYSGYDPEVNTRRSTPVTPGVDYSAYPRNRSFIFGLNLSL